MKPVTANNERDILKGQLAFQRSVIYSLLGVSFALVAGWGWTVMNQVTVIVPPEVKRPYEIGSNYGNKDYLADIANYVLQTILTVTPDSVDFNNKVILKMTDPDGYPKLRADLDGAALRMKHEKVTTVWIPQKEEISEPDKRVKVKGRLKTFIADVLTSEREKEYAVEFNITSSGRLYVLNVKEVVKPDPARPAGQQPD
jgi:conjugal transfer pilus assembly protein TraE